MTETAEANVPGVMTQEQRTQAVQTALNGLQCSMIALQQLGVLSPNTTVNVPGIATPVATPTPAPAPSAPPAATEPPTIPTPAPGAAQATLTTPPRGPDGKFQGSGKGTKKKPKTVEAYKAPTAPNTVGEFVKWFIQSEERDLYGVKRGQWEAIPGVPSKDPEERKAHMLTFKSARLQDSDKSAARNIICIRPINGLVPIFNASRIRYGTSWAAQQNPQRLAEEYGAVPVPFQNVLDPNEGAGLDPQQMEVLDWTGAETMLIPPVGGRWNSSNFNIIERHFAGAVLLKIQDKYFLFDADREELKFHNFNPFFTELPGPAESVADAYNKLMPQEVHDAVAKGTDVIRQGEFFFVRVPDAEVVGDMIKDDFDKRTIEIITQKMDGIGAAVVNTCNADRNCEINKFLDKYPGEQPESGQYAEGWISDVEAKVAGCVALQPTDLGPKEARVRQTNEKNRSTHHGYSVTTHGEGHRNTHLDPYREELAVRLHADHGGDRRYGIRFAQVLEATTGADGRNFRGNGHLVTGMVEKTVKNETHTFARGAVLHRGREHRPAYLPGWYRVYSNTATNNWTVHGDVD